MCVIRLVFARIGRHERDLGEIKVRRGWLLCCDIQGASLSLADSAGARDDLAPARDGGLCRLSFQSDFEVGKGH